MQRGHELLCFYRVQDPVVGLRGLRRVDTGGEPRHRGPFPDASAHVVHGPPPAHHGQPRPRIREVWLVRTAALERRDERVLHAVLGVLRAVKHAAAARHQPAVVVPESLPQLVRHP